MESPPETPTTARKPGMWDKLSALSVRDKTNQPSHARSDISEGDSIRQLANQITQGIKKTRKVDIEPDIFSGNALEFDDWECDFDSYLSSMGVEEGSEKIRYLKKYVKGAARECINGQIIIRTELSYRQARQKLTSRFGNKLDVARSMRNTLDTWQKIPAHDTQALQKYADYLENCSNAMKSISGLSSLDEEISNERFARVLPDWAHTKWGATTHRIRKNEMRYPKFAEFSAFVDDLAEMCSQPLMQSMEKALEKKPRSSNTRSLTTNTSSRTPERKCLYCEDPQHTVAECFMICEKPYSQRMKFATDNMLCYICVKPGHGAAKCSNRGRNICTKCRRPGHATCLHKSKQDWDEERQNSDRYNQRSGAHTTQQWPRSATPHQQTAPTHHQQAHTSAIHHAVSPCVITQTPTPTPLVEYPTLQSDDLIKLSNKNTRTTTQHKLFNMGMPVYVSTASNPLNEVLIYAFLDSASDHSYITKDLVNQLNLGKLGATKLIEIETMTGDVQMDKVNIVNDLIIQGFYGGEVKLPSAYEWKSIPNSTGEFANHTNVLEHPHLQRIANKLPPPMDLPVGLLIGANCTSAFFPLEAIKGGDNKPYALRSELGWAVFGVEEAHSSAEKMHTTHKTNVDEGEDDMLSQDDYQFMKILEAHTTITDAGNYMMPLPFKERPILPNNIGQAQRRQECLNKQLQKQPRLKAEYHKFMNELIEEELAELVYETDVKTGEQWYIPHFAVTHPQKQKLRVVFDCKASYNGTSLNDHLLQGPDLMNSLFGILCRFRRELIAVSCDIQKMFYNFLVPPNDRDYLRFLWYDRDGHPQTYRMKVHLFGAKSSPAVATYGLRKLAKDNSYISKKAAAFINCDFYVDDGITSVATEKEAISLICSSRAICKRGNMRLHKFSSNSAEVLSSLPESERSVQDKDLLTNSLPEQRTLGLQWSMKSDTFKFVNKIQEKPSTRRGILSIVSQLYDPLGFIAPYTLLGKNILQEINKTNIGWDDQIPEDTAIKWRKWMAQLPALEQINISRCLKPKEFGRIIQTELHHFCDASDVGIGACSYMRQVNDKGEVHVAFLVGKSKVVPSKGLFTIPRLELVAAVMATQLSKTLHKELDMTYDGEFFWSDSKIVLGWIYNASKRFNTFVHNRIRVITSETEIQQWNHTPGWCNPADIASRGKQCDQLTESMWFSGPDFLKAANINLYVQDQQNCPRVLDLKDPELKKLKVAKTTADEEPTAISRFAKFSTWTKLTRAVGIIRNIHKTDTKLWSVKPLSIEDIHDSENKIISEVQKHYIKDAYTTIKSGQRLSKSNTSLSKLNPFIDERGILRVGGRLQSSKTLSYQEKHPIILPRDAHVTSLIVRHYHNSTHHQGRMYTLNAVRNAGYWVVGATRLVKSILHNCFICKRLRGRPMEQIMSILPRERVEPAPPFLNVGIDCFGPFVIKERRSEIKRWGLLITCLYSRAIHVELLNDMTSDSFINALRTFICLRGTVETIYCDQGTNFVGASNEFKRELQSLNEKSSTMGTFFKEREISFKFNSPHASHAGGVWERQIRSVREVLEGMLAGRYHNRLDTAGLRTAFYEAMVIVNSQPIAVNHVNDPEVPILTLNHLLTSKANGVVSPPGQFGSTDVYSRKMWRKVQQFAEDFWTLWKFEYMSKITKRQRWEKPRPNIQKGDIVMLLDENLPRNQWLYGMVAEPISSSDGKVRRVKVKMSNQGIDNKGKVITERSTLERPIQKIILLEKHE